nr:hypothetical protein [Streptomyces sp. CBG33]
MEQDQVVAVPLAGLLAAGAGQPPSVGARRPPEPCQAARSRTASPTPTLDLPPGRARRPSRPYGRCAGPHQQRGGPASGTATTWSCSTGPPVDLLRARLPGRGTVDAAAEVPTPRRRRPPPPGPGADRHRRADRRPRRRRRRHRLRHRRLLFPDHPGPEYAGFTTWRIMVPAPAEPFAPHETWGRAPCGQPPAPRRHRLPYAAAAVPEGGHAEDERAELLRDGTIGGGTVPALLAAAAPEGVLRHDVRHMRRPLPAHHAAGSPSSGTPPTP